METVRYVLGIFIVAGRRSSPTPTSGGGLLDKGARVVALLTLPAIHAVVLLEERELVDRFGDVYRDYIVRVPRRYIPSGNRASTSPSAP